MLFLHKNRCWERLPIKEYCFVKRRNEEYILFREDSRKKETAGILLWRERMYSIRGQFDEFIRKCLGFCYRLKHFSRFLGTLAIIRKNFIWKCARSISFKLENHHQGNKLLDQTRRKNWDFRAYRSRQVHYYLNFNEGFRAV